MSDLISKAKVLETYSELYWFDSDCEVVSKAEVDKIYELLQSLPSAEPQWIPVSERLPKEYAQYLAYFKNGECYVYWLEDSDWSRSIIELEEIVAWMPLPEPYREDGE